MWDWNCWENYIANDDEIEPFKCSQCDATFRTEAKLMKHRRSHITGKIFNSDVCDKSFKTDGMLKGHEQTESIRKHGGW